MTSAVTIRNVTKRFGSQKAVEVHIFAESQRGQGDGHRPGWYGAQNGTMTNGAVEPTGAVLASAGGGEPSFIVKYKEGLVFTSACALGLVPKGLMQDDYTWLNWYLDNLGDQF